MCGVILTQANEFLGISSSKIKYALHFDFCQWQISLANFSMKSDIVDMVLSPVHDNISIMRLVNCKPNPAGVQIRRCNSK